MIAKKCVRVIGHARFESDYERYDANSGTLKAPLRYEEKDTDGIKSRGKPVTEVLGPVR